MRRTTGARSDTIIERRSEMLIRPVWLAILLMLLTFGFANSTARAGGFPEAEKAFAIGKLLVDMGDATRGLFELKKAASILPSARYLSKIVKVYRDLGKDDMALIYGERYLANTPKDEQDEGLASWIRQTRERFRKSRARLVVRPHPVDARVEFLDGGGLRHAGVREAPDRPLVWWVNPGKGTLKIRREDYETTSREVDIKTGADEEVTIELKRIGGVGDLVIEANIRKAEVRIDGEVVGSAPVKLSRPAGRYLVQVWAEGKANWTGYVDVSPDKTTTVKADLRQATTATSPDKVKLNWKPSRKKWRLSTWGWITGGLGLAMLGAAGYTYSVVFSKADEITGLPTGDSRRKDLEAEMNQNFLYTVVLGGLGGAALGGGLLMIILDDGSSADKEATLELLSFTPVWTPDRFVLQTGFNF
jgi:hypothetical protein